MKLFKLLKLFTLHPTRYTLHATRYALHATRYTLPAMPYTLLAIFLITGCATPAREMPDTSQLQWPLPPSEARVKYVRYWGGEDDFPKSFSEAVGGEAGIPGLAMPRSVTTDRQGNIYVADFAIKGLGLVVFDLKAEKFRVIETRGAVTIKKPVDILVDDNGDMWVADVGRNLVLVYNKDGDFIRPIGREGELKGPIRIAMDKRRERLYVLDKELHNIRVYDLSGRLLFTIGDTKPRIEPGYFFGPQGIALDSEGNIYVVDTFNFRVQSFTPDGKLRFAFGEAGDAFGNFGRPVAVAVDSEGNIYVTDTLFNNIQVFNREGKYIFTIGESGFNPGQFELPTGIHIDENDRIYVADHLHSVIQVFQYLSEKWKKSQAEQPKK